MLFDLAAGRCGAACARPRGSFA